MKVWQNILRPRFVVSVKKLVFVVIIQCRLLVGTTDQKKKIVPDKRIAVHFENCTLHVKDVFAN